MDINKMTLKQIEERKLEIKDLLDQEGCDVDALADEVKALEERRATLMAEIEERKDKMKEVLAGAGKKIATFEEERTVPEKFNIGSAEYKSAFFKTLRGETLNQDESRAMNDVMEQRGIAVGNIASSALALPREVADEIYDAMEEQHGLLKEIKIYRTGTVLEVQKRTGITAGDAAVTNENTANAEEENTLVKVVLAGKDFSKNVTISYAALQMSDDALEDFLVTEISERLGAALASDIVAQIGTDKTTTNTVKASPDYADLAALLGKVKGGTPKLCVSSSSYYTKLLGLVDDAGQPVFRQGVNSLAEVIIEDAAGTDIIALVPSKVVGNMVQDIMVESDRDIKNHSVIFSGYARFECTLAVTSAAAFIKEE